MSKIDKFLPSLFNSSPSSSIMPLYHLISISYMLGCSPWGHEELDTTERPHLHFSLSCIGEGNGSPLRCSCLENPRDRGTSWAAVYGVAQSRTRLKQLSSSSSYMLRKSIGSDTVLLYEGSN